MQAFDKKNKNLKTRTMKKNVEQYLAFKRGDVKMPEHLAIKKELSGKLFENKLLERLSRTGIFAPIILHVTISSFLLWYGITTLGLPLQPTLLLIGGGFVFWTFAEYNVHRFLYHTETNSDFLFRLQHNAHGVHHNHPIDPTRLAMPPLPGLILSSLFFLLFWLVMGNFVFAFFPGFMMGYLAYISFHYAQHRIKSPKWPPFRKLWRHHDVHHYVNPYVAHGVSTRLWDFVFGTMPKQRMRDEAAKF